MQPSTLTRDEVVEFANVIYGDAWRDGLAKHLNITRKQLVLTLADDGDVPESIANPLLLLIEGYVQEQEAKRHKMASRVAEIRRALPKNNPPRAERRSAS